MSEIRRRQMLGWVGTAAAGAATLSLQGCMTTMLHEQKQYVESFSAMYITQDKRQIVILGPSHHYIFEAPAELVRLVQSSLHPRLQARFEGFVVAPDQSITGRYGLVLHPPRGGYSPEQLALAHSLGMAAQNGGEWTIGGTLKGKRYAAGDFARGDEGMTRLNQRYSVTIQEQPALGEAIGRAALTPVTLAADGVLMMASMLLLPLVMTFVAVDMQR